MNDCSYLTLYYSKDGYVIKCVYCHKIQLAFGNIILNLSLDEFQNFRYQTIDKLNENKSTGFPDQRNISFPTASTNIRMVFSFKDLGLLYEMLQQANLILEINNLILNQN